MTSSPTALLEALKHSSVSKLQRVWREDTKCGSTIYQEKFRKQATYYKTLKYCQLKEGYISPSFGHLKLGI